jgi:hypothetical protein
MNQTSLLYILKSNLVQNYWYSIFMNFSNFYRQVSLDLWVRKWNETNLNPPQTSDLENIFSSTQIIEPQDLSVNENYSLLAANLVTTNYRLYDKIETDLSKQVLLLNQTIVSDAQFSIIIDNAIPRLTLPWIGQTK